MPIPDKLRHSGVVAARYARPVSIVAAFLLPIGLIVHAITFWGHGIIDSEAMEFVLNYLQPRPFFAQIFDPQINDWGAYQARELSYVFDLIDARVFAALLDRHLLVFVPLSGVLGLIAASGVYFWGARRVLGLNNVTASLLLALFLSCVVVQASTPILYRSSKIILSVALLAFLFCNFALLKTGNQHVTPRNGAGLFSLGVLMALTDRQGFYYLVSATMVALIAWGVAKIKRRTIQGAHLELSLINFGAIAAVIFYNRIFAPHLIHALNGYWPNFSYQNLPWSKLLDPTLPAKACYLFDQQVSFFFGNVPFLALIGVALLALLLVAWKRPTAITNNLPLIALSLVSVAALLGLLGTMVARHPALYSMRDHSFWYYTLTLHVVFLFGISVWLSLMNSNGPTRFQPLLYVLIAVLIALNVRTYRQQQRTMIAANGWFQGQHEHSQALVEQFAAAPPNREELSAETSDLFLDDQAHFLENVERSYLYLRSKAASPQKR